MATNDDNGLRKTVYVHIGHLKTGTTAIQNCLFEHRQFLLEQGVHYIQTGLASETAIGRRHYFLSKNILQKKEAGQCLWDKVKSEIETSAATKFVISYEGLIRLAPAEVNVISQALKAFDVKIICYLRDQVSFLQSLYLEYVQNHQFKKSFREFEGSFNWQGRYFDLLSIWQHQFGSANMVVSDFSAIVKQKRDVVEHFMTVIGEQNHYKKIKSSSSIANPSLKPWTGYLAAINNTNAKNLTKRRQFARQTVTELWSRLKKTKWLVKDQASLVTAKGALGLQAKFAEQNYLLQQAFGVGQAFNDLTIAQSIKKNKKPLVFSLTNFNRKWLSLVEKKKHLAPWFVLWLRVENYVTARSPLNRKSQLNVDGFPISKSDEQYWRSLLSNSIELHNSAVLSQPVEGNENNSESPITNNTEQVSFDCIVDVSSIPLGLFRRFLINNFPVLNQAEKLLLLIASEGKTKGQATSQEQMTSLLDLFRLEYKWVSDSESLNNVTNNNVVVMSAWDIVEPGLIPELKNFSANTPQKMISYFDFIDWHDTPYKSEPEGSAMTLVALNKVAVEKSQSSLKHLVSNLTEQTTELATNERQLIANDSKVLVHIRLNKVSHSVIN